MSDTRTEAYNKLIARVFPNNSRAITGLKNQEALLILLDYLDINGINALIQAALAGSDVIFANEDEKDEYTLMTEGTKGYVVSTATLYKYESSAWVEISTLAELQGSRVVFKQETANIASVNNLDLTSAQFYIFSDNTNNLQLIDSVGIQGGTAVIIEHKEGQTVEHLATASGDYKSINLSTKANHTFTNDTVVMYVYDELEQVYKEVGRVTLGESESEITLPTVKLVQFPAYNMTTGGAITGLTTLMQTAVTVTNKGTAGIGLLDGYIFMSAGTIYGIEGFDSSGAKVFEIPCFESNVDRPEILEIVNKIVLILEGAKTVVPQDDYKKINENGWNLIINGTDYFYSIKDDNKQVIF